MGYCIDDICHNAGPICGAGSPYHCRADGGPPADHYCDDPGCETCMPWDDDYDSQLLREMYEAEMWQRIDAEDRALTQEDKP